MESVATNFDNSEVGVESGSERPKVESICGVGGGSYNSIVEESFNVVDSSARTN